MSYAGHRRRGIGVHISGGSPCALANNHVLDFGVRGLRDTLDVLTGANLRPAGAGRDDAEAWIPATVQAGA
ncbi:MAG: CapA family protein, partial [Pseudonocardiaceae bacterium]